MKYIVVVPHLHRNGGIKVAMQQTHLLNENGKEAFLTTPAGEIKATQVNYGELPFINYNKCKIVSWEEAENLIEPEDIIIHNWGENIKEFARDKNNKKFYFAQACFFTPEENLNNLDLYGQPEVLKDDIQIVSISDEVQRYFLYGFKKNTKKINNWINTDIFKPEESRRVKNRVGMIAHRAYAANSLVEKIKNSGFNFIMMHGTENDIAKDMQTCEYFVSCSMGIHNGWRETEGFPLPSAEAMACGCLTISYHNGGCVEYMSDKINSFVTNKNTEDMLMKELIRARDCLYKEEIKRNAIDSIKRRFNKEEIFKQMMEAYAL